MKLTCCWSFSWFSLLSSSCCLVGAGTFAYVVLHFRFSSFPFITSRLRLVLICIWCSCFQINTHGRCTGENLFCKYCRLSHLWLVWKANFLEDFLEDLSENILPVESVLRLQLSTHGYEVWLKCDELQGWVTSRAVLRRVPCNFGWKCRSSHARFEAGPWVKKIQAAISELTI